jgi:hypothetical protein
MIVSFKGLRIVEEEFLSGHHVTRRARFRISIVHHQTGTAPKVELVGALSRVDADESRASSDERQTNGGQSSGGTVAGVRL